MLWCVVAWQWGKRLSALVQAWGSEQTAAECTLAGSELSAKGFHAEALQQHEATWTEQGCTAAGDGTPAR
jgi:hypothetical protein